MRGGGQFRSGFLKGVFHAEIRRSFIWRISYFCEGTSRSFFSGRTSRSFFQGLLGSGVSNEAVTSKRCSPEDMLSEFRGAAGRNDKMER